MPIYQTIPSPRRPTRPRAAFTLIEILVVIAVIVLLAGITIMVASSVKKNAAIKNTKARLLTLKQMMTQYLENAPAFPLSDPSFAPGPPVSDQAMWVRMLRSTKNGQSLDNMPQDTSKLNVLDDFGTPIRYVPAGVPTGGPSNVVEGYFWSYGPDQLPNTPDDIRSTEAN